MSLVRARLRTLAVPLSTALVFAVISFGAAPAAHAAGFGPPTKVTDLNAGEPGVDVASDGTIYVNAPSGLLSNLPGSPSWVFRSSDGGATWTLTPASLRANLPGGGDSDIAIDPQTGALYMTDLWLFSATVSSSTDRGNTWVANPVQGTIVQDRQWIATGGGGRVYHVTHQIPSGLVVATSVDGGVTFPLQTVAASVVDQTGCVCPPGNLIAASGGLLADKVGVIYATSTGGIKFARSTNGAVTFSNAQVSPTSSADTTAAFPVVSDAGNNTLVAAWMEIVGNSSRVMVNTSSDWGSTWGTPRALVSAGTSVYPWVAAQGGKVVVTLYHTAASGTPDTVAEGSQWFESFVESTDGGATFSPLASIDPVAVKTGPICTSGTGCSGDRELLDFQSVTIDGQGRANAVWTRSLDGVSDTQLWFSREG